MFQERPLIRKLEESDVDAEGKLKLDEDDEEEHHSAFERAKLFLESEEECGVGDLIITTRRVVWKPEEVSRGFSFDFRGIVLHAVSRDTSSFPFPCIYCQFDSDDIPEGRIVLEEDTQLNELFQNMSECAELNPDDDEDEDEGEGSGWIYNEDEIQEGSRQEAVLNHLDSVLHISENGHNPEVVTEGQFDDPEETTEDHQDRSH